MGRFDLPEERGQKTHVRSGRAGRLLKLGNLAASVSSRMVGGRIRQTLLAPFQSAEAAEQARLRGFVGVAERVVETMGEMKGAAMKIGQMLSQGLTDFPDEVSRILSRLQDAAPPMDFPLVSAQIEAAFDLPIHELFRYFDWRPVASASIGQVHRAQLPDGTPVAVKVQYPGLADSLDSDLDNLRMLLRLGRVVMKSEVVEAYDREVRDVLRAELDYEREARNILRFRSIYEAGGNGRGNGSGNVRGSGRGSGGGADRAGGDGGGAPSPVRFGRRVRVPRVFPEYTRPTVLTMEYLEGEKLDAYLERVTDPAERNRTALLLFDVFARMFHEVHLLHADPHPGNYLLDRDGNLILLDYGCVREFRPEFTDGCLRVVQALRRGDAAALPGLFRTLGWHNVDRFDVPRLEELARLVLAPYVAQGDFALGRWDVPSQFQRWLQKNLSFLHFQPPSEAIFFFRTCAGLLGHMRRLDACGDFAGTISEIMRRRGIDP